MQKLEDLIKKRKAKVGIIGLGYVGLPYCVEIARTGFDVFGFDIQKKKVDSLNKGKSYIEFIKDQQIKEILKEKKFKAFNTYSFLKNIDIILLCVPTPLDKNKNPDLSYLENSLNQIKNYLHKEELIILVSTSFPGTTQELALPILENSGLKGGKDFYLAYAPERIDPARNIDFSEIPKIVGGITKKCTKLALLFFSQFTKNVYPVSCPKVAEMAKLLENTFRLINISFINELALLCEKMGIDIWEVIEAASTKPYGFMPFFPGPGVGGHCIKVDPYYLSWKANEYNFFCRFVKLAGEINDLMPHEIVTKVVWALNLKKKPLRGSKILIWGVTYKKDVADTRETAAIPIIWDLLRKGAKIDYFDPYIKKFELKNHLFKKRLFLNSIKYKKEILKNYDLVLILADHSGFDYDQIAKNSKMVVDTRNAIKSRKYKNVFWL